MVSIPFRIDANMGLLIYSNCQFLNENYDARAVLFVYSPKYMQARVRATLRRRNIVAHTNSKVIMNDISSGHTKYDNLYPMWWHTHKQMHIHKRVRTRALQLFRCLLICFRSLVLAHSFQKVQSASSGLTVNEWQRIVAYNMFNIVHYTT